MVGILLPVTSPMLLITPSRANCERVPLQFMSPFEKAVNLDEVPVPEELYPGM